MKPGIRSKPLTRYRVPEEYQEVWPRGRYILNPMVRWIRGRAAIAWIHGSRNKFAKKLKKSDFNQVLNDPEYREFFESLYLTPSGLRSLFFVYTVRGAIIGRWRHFIAFWLLPFSVAAILALIPLGHRTSSYNLTGEFPYFIYFNCFGAIFLLLFTLAPIAHVERTTPIGSLMGCLLYPITLWLLAIFCVVVLPTAMLQAITASLTWLLHDFSVHFLVLSLGIFVARHRIRRRMVLSTVRRTRMNLCEMERGTLEIVTE